MTDESNQLSDTNKSTTKKLVSFNVLLTNARSLSPKISSLIMYITEHDVSVAIVSEMWLKPGTELDQEIGNLRKGENMDLFHFSRKLSKKGRSSGGGVAILANRKFCSLKEFKITRGRADCMHYWKALRDIQTPGCHRNIYISKV